jgi:hypothetical protein
LKNHARNRAYFGRQTIDEGAYAGRWERLADATYKICVEVNCACDSVRVTHSGSGEAMTTTAIQLSA